MKTKIVIYDPPMCCVSGVCEIEDCLEMIQSNVSRRLTAFKNSGILDSYKKAQWVYYKVSDKFKEENQNLWLYLIQKLKERPRYQSLQQLCNSRSDCDTDVSKNYK